MHVDNGKGSMVRLIAGFFVLASVLLGFFVSKYFFYFTGLVGFMLFQSAITGFCPMEYILKALGVPEKDRKNCCC